MAFAPDPEYQVTEVLPEPLPDPDPKSVVEDDAADGDA